MGPRVVYIVTVPLSARALLQGQLGYMRARGFEVVVISSPGDDLRIVAEREGITTLTVPMRREISPFHDLVALWRLYRVVRRLGPAIVNASTPKAGLLGMIAAWLARVPVRVYTLRGLRLETLHGLKRGISLLTERIASLCAGRVVCVGESLRRLYVGLGLAPATKTVVLACGSSNGVDPRRFTPTGDAQSAVLREQLGLPPGAPVIGFVGRFTRDKGILDLLGAFKELANSLPNAHLLLVGDFEEGDPIPAADVQQLRTHPRVALAGFQPDPAPYFPLMDVFAFPSYREGFPNVPLHAAAAGVPVVGFAATGTVDAVQHGVTGTLVPPGDTRALARALTMYLADAELRRRHGHAGRERVSRDFRPEVIWEALYQEYLRLLREKGVAVQLEV